MRWVLLASFLSLGKCTTPTISCEDSKDETCGWPEEEQDDDDCQLWLGESLHPIAGALGGNLGLFIGSAKSADQRLVENGGEPHIPVFDTNRHEWSRLHDVVWNAGIISQDTLNHADFHSHSFLPGIGISAACDDENANAYLETEEEVVDSLGVHRSQHPETGSFTYRNHQEFKASTSLKPGQEIFVHCDQAREDDDDDDDDDDDYDPPHIPLQQLKEHAVCVDNIVVKPSTIPRIGRGAFAQRSYKKGDIVTYSPVIAFEQSQLFIVEQEYDKKEKEMSYGERIDGRQLLENYVYSYPESSVFLLPIGPGVNYINHSLEKSNIQLKWSSHPLNGDLEFLKLVDVELYVQDRLTMIVEYVATADINKGDELFLNYGTEWQTEMDEHREDYEPPPFANSYTSASEYLKAHPEEPMKTMEELKQSKYPRNLQTACMYRETFQDERELWRFFPDSNDNQTSPNLWQERNRGCLRPCRILERSSTPPYEYTAEVRNIETELAHFDKECGLNGKKKIVTNIPETAVKLMNRKYTADEHLTTTFRHYIQVPDDFYPDVWLHDDDEDMGTFELSELDIGELQLIRWSQKSLPSKAGQVVAPHAYRMGLDKEIRMVLLEYINDLNMLEYFKHYTYQGNPLKAGRKNTIELGELEWNVQRPPPHWNSNMHWISPANAETHSDFLQVLSFAGFDKVLQSLGETLGLNGLAAYHLSFVAVSYCTAGFVHKDVDGTGGKAFNLIIPLILAEDTGPELDISDSDKGDRLLGRLRYEEDVAVLVGDGAFHATSACDYRATREMRVAATIYVADISEENIDEIMDHYTQAYPPPDQPEVLLEMAGTHWSSTDPDVKLPVYIPPEGEDFFDADDEDSYD